MEEIFDWTTSEDLMIKIYARMKAGDGQINFARLTLNEDFDCDPDHLTSETSGRAILEHLQGRARQIVRRLLTANFTLIIINDDHVTLGVYLKP